MSDRAESLADEIMSRIVWSRSDLLAAIRRHYPEESAELDFLKSELERVRYENVALKAEVERLKSYREALSDTSGTSRSPVP